MHTEQIKNEKQTAIYHHPPVYFFQPLPSLFYVGRGVVPFRAGGHLPDQKFCDGYDDDDDGELVS